MVAGMLAHAHMKDSTCAGASIRLCHWTLSTFLLFWWGLLGKA